MFLGRGIAAACLAAVLGAAGQASAAEASTLERRIKAGSEKVQQGDCRGSLKHWDAALSDKDFPEMPDFGKNAIYGIAAACALEIDRLDRAYRYVREGTDQAAGSEPLWQLRFQIELDGKRNAEAVETVEAMARRNPGALNAMPIRWLIPINSKLRTQPELQFRLLRVLSSPAYRPQEVAVTTDNFKREYASLLAEAGNTAEALELARTIEDPSALLLASVDPRLRAALPDEFDGRAEVERSLAKARSIAVSHPDDLAAVSLVARHLRMLGRPEEALATLQATPPAPTSPEAGLAEQHVNWWWDGAARSYEMLGRYDEAVNAFRGGIASKERGISNVSQRLNLGYAQWRFGRPAEALVTVSGLDKGKLAVSPYGAMVLRLVRGCSLLATGQVAAAKVDLAYAAEHEQEHEHQEALTTLQLCAGDLDGAAATLIRRLDDPRRRAQALLLLSEFDAPPVALPATPAEARLPEIKARPDVQAAISRAGGTRRYRLQGSEF